MSEGRLTISQAVKDRRGHVRWVVVGTFVGVDGSEPRCIDYRVRVVPEMDSVEMSSGVAKQLAILLADDAEQDRSLYRAAEQSAPSEGIPRRVFEEASQTRLLEMARDLVRRGRVEPVELLTRQERPRRGRPPARSLGEKLRILESVERAFASGHTLDDVAREHHLSRGSVRNLLAWARTDAEPQLFEGTTPGRRGGRLTPAARTMLEKGVD
ncbi:hypothetical protein [Terrabacter sp. Root181]|uniref:hypothetical protein n=1 Tax=Terrabacter sp. Root181 TaxID=1736484 RepID=UPI0006F4339B|nr:hypothetical protein [Terrabacter sp. Root181]KRB45001.1 hypothetical protein ASD90_15000 [Terrabacter sp. Root181]